ncbi:LLM class flavin-dependent oxidoreductase [Allostreptomyces psammosilenae]|uniref:Alkanesulfonate monooxygenase SsuD/methylene tetrahydromethanopterin reductase-like flavin-dependent oxidoreductase (Luciferase family) n=1 Tax=Allostreptomyces psammosilenae TaxID=1892865 RepID=A0A853A0I8_9ACTN|nr:LLM class flavin-dependent oxidoreductase [Allostreptomyces psammosilenae]NYI04331.1 alkanesulfonate monooxygenase SsuD/methylene tetrahydromethanopterin reductase-like flavin-dependent oxidoreductase (luciferase family) [Allostreptomyces psammosilenae]
MKFVVFTLISNAPDAVTGQEYSQNQRLLETVEQAVLAEELGYDAFGVGERHGAPFLSSAPPVVLAHIAARTRRVRLLTTVTVLSVLDPVRVAEDYATLDHLSGGRLELVIGKGNDSRHFPLFGLEASHQWEYLAENYALLKLLWEKEDVHWQGNYRAPLRGVTTQPRPLQLPVRVWHGSATSTLSTELAAYHGDPLFSANGFHPLEKYAALVRHYRERWEAHGHDPKDAVVAAGSGGCYVARTSQQAIREYRPYFDAFRATAAAKANASPFHTLEEAVADGSALVGSPEQVIDKVGRWYEAFGHELLGLGVDAFPAKVQREQLETFAAEVAPALRTLAPSRLWEPSGRDLVHAHPAAPSAEGRPAAELDGAPAA